MTPLIGLVSGTYNRLDLLKRMVESFRDNIPAGISYTITLVDGGSTDGTLEWIAEQPDINLIADGALRGAISAFTRGAFATQAKYIVMSNDDVEFVQGAIMRAFVHLEDTPSCGAVAFGDNRPVPPYLSDKDFKVLTMPGEKNGAQISIVYAQVGMFRKWLGDLCDWWGANTAMREAKTYGGDNHLSAHIWARGYTVDAVPGSRVIDRVANDELRQINGAAGKIANVSDSEYYYNQWGRPTRGPRIPPMPTEAQQDVPSIRVLYLPIFDPGWPIAKRTKHGLRDALSRAVTPKGWRLAVREFDYFSVSPAQLEEELLRVAEEFEPRLILTQIQAHQPLTAQILQRLRLRHPRASIINWNGDVALGGLVSQEMIGLLRNVDLQLVVNAGVLEKYKELGIPAAYWQIGYEDPGDDLPDMPAHDVVFLGSFSNPARLPLLEVLDGLKAEGIDVGIYQAGDPSATLYDFAKGAALYRNAKLAIGSNEYPDDYGFFSNRVLQVMSAGGALYLQQRVEGMKELTGLLAGAHYIQWSEVEKLASEIRYWLLPSNDEDRRKIAESGARFVRQFHSFDQRVVELFELIRKHLQPHRDVEANAVLLRYVGRSQDEFGILGKSTGIHYQYVPGRLLTVDKLDAPYMLAERNLWEVATG